MSTIRISVSQIDNWNDFVRTAKSLFENESTYIAIEDPLSKPVIATDTALNLLSESKSIGRIFSESKELSWRHQNKSYDVTYIGANIPDNFQELSGDWSVKELPVFLIGKKFRNTNEWRDSRFPNSISYPSGNDNVQVLTETIVDKRTHQTCFTRWKKIL